MTLCKDEVLRSLGLLRSDEVVVTTMGMVRPWARYSESDLDFASADSAMGHAADLALGIALAQPDRRVLCLNGDGSLLMCLGTLATIVESGAGNLVLFNVQNDSYEVTGNQPVPAAGRIDFPGLARAAGIKEVFAFADRENYEKRIESVLRVPGPVFVNVLVAPGEETPLARGDVAPERYLKLSLAESAHHLRRVLLAGLKG